MEANSLVYKMFCNQNLEEVVRDHDNKGYINFAVDFDGVLCKSAYPEIGKPNLKMIHYLIEQREKGNKVILWTARADEDLQEAIDWCAGYGLGFDFVNEGDPVIEEMYRTPGQTEPTRKIHADVYIDDRNMAPLNIWPVQCSEEEVTESEAAFKSGAREFDGKKIPEMESDIAAAAFASAMEGVDLVEDKAVHKAEHYQNGEFEVIDEMIIVFGVEAALQFCRLNAWKYRARAAYKGSAAEDMKKSDEYLKMAYEIMGRRSRTFGIATDDSLCLIGDRE